MDDASSVFDASILTGPVANYPGGRQLQPRARARLLDRRHPARVRRVGGVGPAVRRGPRAPCRAACSARSSTTGRSTGVVTLQSGVPIAVTQTTNNNAFAGFRHAAAEPGRRSRAAGRRALDRAAGSTPAPSPPRRSSRSAPRSRNPVRGPGYRNLDLALMRRVPLPRAHALELRAEVFNLTNTPPLGAPNGAVGRRRVRHDHDARAIRAWCSWR